MDGANDDLDSDIEAESEANCEDNSGEINRFHEQHGVRFLLSRSLLPKMDSMVDAFCSLNLDFASITETWFRNGKLLKDRLTDLEGSSGIKIIHQSRDGRRSRIGGGVAIAFNLSSCNFKNRALKHVGKEFEVLCVTGRVGKIERRVVVFTVYVPPGIKASALDTLREQLAAEIAAVKVTYKDPIIVVNGDFNHRDIGGAISEVEKFDLVPTGPTRGTATIDLVYTNIADNINEVLNLPPLQSLGGVDSDHGGVFVGATFQPRKKFEWVVFTHHLQLHRTTTHLTSRPSINAS